MNLRDRNEKRHLFVRKHLNKMKKLAPLIALGGKNFLNLPDAKKIIEAARRQLDYSPWTSNFDVLIRLFYSYKKMSAKI